MSPYRPLVNLSVSSQSLNLSHHAAGCPPVFSTHILSHLISSCGVHVLLAPKFLRQLQSPL